MKTLRPTKRITGFFGYKFANAPFRCVITGVDWNMDYGDLFNQYFRDPSTMQARPFRPWTGVIEGKGRQLNEPTVLRLAALPSIAKVEQEEQENERGFFKAMKKKGVKFVPIEEPKEESSADC